MLTPSGNGQARETAQWSYATTQNPDLVAYIVHTVLDPVVKWCVCTNAEALYFQNSGYQLWRVVDGHKVVFRRKAEHDSNAACATQFK